MENAGERLIDAAQALLTGYDTTLSRQWREEERAWRQQDMQWRDQERYYAELDARFMQQERDWRKADLKQRHLENAHVLWTRYVARNSREVEEKSEQLKAISSLAAIIAGFAVIAFLEFQFEFRDPSHFLLPLYGACFAATVGLELNAVVICSLMLSSILKASKEYVSAEEEAEFMARAATFAETYKPGERPPAPPRSFAMHWARRCEAKWRQAFYFFTAGIPCNFATLAVSGWIKFDGSPATAVLVTVIMGLATLLVAYFMNQWSGHLLSSEEPREYTERVQLPPLDLPWDWHRLPASRAAAGGGPGGQLGSMSTAGGVPGGQGGSMSTPPQSLPASDKLAGSEGEEGGLGRQQQQRQQQQQQQAVWRHEQRQSSDDPP